MGITSISGILFTAAAGFAVLSLILFAVGISALRRRSWVGSLGGGGMGTLLLSLAALAGTLGLSTQGYRAFTHEELAATVTTVPTGPQAFQAYVQFPDGGSHTLPVAGDQLMVDAHILKWHPWANVLGLHTHYELDRLTGRYREIEEERTLTRTIHSLKEEKPVDLFHLVRDHHLLTFLVDAEYGSATYIEVDRPARFEVRVSTTGLLIREVEFE